MRSGIRRRALDAACVDPAEAIGPIAGYMLTLLAGLPLVACIPWLSLSR